MSYLHEQEGFLLEILNTFRGRLIPVRTQQDQYDFVPMQQFVENCLGVCTTDFPWSLLSPKLHKDPKQGKTPSQKLTLLAYQAVVDYLCAWRNEVCTEPALANLINEQIEELRNIIEHDNIGEDVYEALAEIEFPTQDSTISYSNKPYVLQSVHYQMLKEAYNHGRRDMKREISEQQEQQSVAPTYLTGHQRRRLIKNLIKSLSSPENRLGATFNLTDEREMDMYISWFGMMHQPISIDKIEPMYANLDEASRNKFLEMVGEYNTRQFGVKKEVKWHVKLEQNMRCFLRAILQSKR